jgi:hypothetical protein
MVSYLLMKTLACAVIAGSALFTTLMYRAISPRSVANQYEYYQYAAVGIILILCAVNASPRRVCHVNLVPILAGALPAAVLCILIYPEYADTRGKSKPPGIAYSDLLYPINMFVTLLSTTIATLCIILFRPRDRGWIRLGEQDITSSPSTPNPTS